MKFWVY